MALTAEMDSDLYSSFDYCLKALQIDKNKELYPRILKQLFSVSKKIVLDEGRKHIFQKYIEKLEYEGVTPVKTEIDEYPD